MDIDTRRQRKFTGLVSRWAAYLDIVMHSRSDARGVSVLHALGVPRLLRRDDVSAVAVHLTPNLHVNVLHLDGWCSRAWHLSQLRRPPRVGCDSSWQDVLSERYEAIVVIVALIKRSIKSHGLTQSMIVILNAAVRVRTQSPNGEDRLALQTTRPREEQEP